MDDLGIEPLGIEPLNEDLGIESLGIEPLEQAPARKPRKNENYGNEGRRTPQPGESDLDAAGRKSMGLLQAAGGMVAGLPSQIAGGLYGLGALTSGQGPAEAARRLEAAQKWNFGMGEFKPWTETGEKYTEGAGKAMEKVLKAPGSVIGRFSPEGQLASDVFMEAGANFLPLPVGVKGMRGGANKISKLRERGTETPTTQSKIDGILAEKVAEKPVAPADLGIEPVQSPVTAAMQPMERMVAELSPGAERAIVPEAQSPAMGAMANDLQRPTSPGTRAADDLMARRQAEMEQQVARQTSLDMNAAERARQQAAPAVSPAEQGRMAAMEQARLAAESEKMQNMHQMEIDDTQHVLPDSGQLYGDQYGAAEGVGRVDENGMPIRADRSIEVQQLQNPLQRNLWGDELAHTGLEGTNVPLTQAIDAIPGSPFRNDARDTALSRFRERGVVSDELAKAVGVVLRRTATGIEAVRDGKVVGHLESNMTPEQNKQLGYDKEYPAAINIVKAEKGQGIGKALYQAWSEDHNGNIAPSGKTTQDAWNVWKRDFPEKVSDFVANEAERIRQGASAEQVLSNVKDPDIARAITAQVWEPGKDLPRTGLYKKQGGVLYLGGEKKAALDTIKGIGAFAHQMRNIIPEKLTPEAFVEKYKTAPDVKQNIFQKASNQLTKGGIYMAERLDNPLYSRVVDDFLAADGRAKAAFNEFVNEDYAPKARKMDNKERTDAWGALKRMEKADARLTDSEMSAVGLNQKQKDFINSHWNLMDNIFPKINETMSRLGMDPIKPEAAYVASKATGMFRTLVYKGDKPVGIVGSDSRAGMKKDLASYLASNPEYKAGPEMVMGKGKRHLTDNVEDMLSFLSSNDPDVLQFLQDSKEVMNEAAFKYRGANTHTMAKRGIEGFEGGKPWEDAHTNAHEGIEAQVAYAHRMFEWAEKAKAVESTRELIRNPELNMPEAKKHAEDYMNTALGRNPTVAGAAIDNLLHAALEASGGKARHLGTLVGGTKQYLNTKLLKLDLGFLATQALQPIAASPEMAAFLRSRGAKGTQLGYADMAEGLIKGIEGKDMLSQQALKYARDNHVFASDLVGHSGATRTGVQSMWDVTDRPAQIIERDTRRAMYVGMVHTLAKQGITPEKGLFEGAARLTDMAMGNYSKQEMPRIFQQMGRLGEGPYNLSTFKHNELSRMALLAREIGNNKNARPFLTALAMQVAKAGILGTVGFKGAEWAVEQISEAMGTPVNLTKLLLDNADKKIVGPVTVKDAAYGLPGQANVDLTGRMGMGDLLPSGPDLLMPGASAIGQAATSGYEYGKDPASMGKFKRAITDILPGGRHLEGFLFDKPIQGSENTMGLNRNKVTATVERTPYESALKKGGFTSVNEAATKSLVFQNQKMDRFYADKQAAALDSMKWDLYDNGKIRPEVIQKYAKAQGDLETLNKLIDQWAQEQNISVEKRDAIKASAGNSVGTAGKLIRRFKKD